MVKSLHPFAISFCFFILLLFVINSVQSQSNDTNNDSEKCYGILGCFGSSDFADLNGKPITFLPQSPEEINITFRLYTSENPYSSIDFKYNLEQFQLNNSPFNPRKKVKFIIHGFTGSFNEMDWMGGIKDLILEGQPNKYNVFGVDWSNGAKTINYFQAVANTRVVGAAMAHFIKKLNQYSGMKFSDVHLIGHSLGAHVSGYTGERIQDPQIGRITGLDPAGPSFYKNLTTLRLDPTDANYVDALHTDYGNAVIEGLGLEDPVGDIDFYPNGGYRQPACGKTKGLFNVLNQGLIKGITETVACNHNFAPRFMLVNPESLTENCQFVGYQCKNYEEFEKGRCTDCGQDGKKCAVLSIFGETDRGSGQAFKEQKQEQFRDRALKRYYYKTSDKVPYCLHHYGIEIHLANNSETATGSFTLDLEGSKRKADGIKVSETFSSFKPGETYTFLVTYEKSLGPLRRATMKWAFQGIDVLNPIKLISSPKMIIDRLSVKFLSNIDPRIRQEESAVLCPERSDTVSSGSQLGFVPCQGGQSNGNYEGASRFTNGQSNNHRPQPQGSNYGTTSRPAHGNNNGFSNSSNRPHQQGGHGGQTYPNRPTHQGNNHQGNHQGNNHENNRENERENNRGNGYGSNRNQYSTSNYETSSRYSTTPSYGSNSRYSTTSRYQPSNQNNNGDGYGNNRGTNHGSNHGNNHGSNYENNHESNRGSGYGSNRNQYSTSSYESSTRYSTTPGYSSTSRYQPSNQNNRYSTSATSDYHSTPSYGSSTSRYGQTPPSRHSGHNYPSTPDYKPPSNHRPSSVFPSIFNRPTSSPDRRFDETSSESEYPSASNRRPTSSSFSLRNGPGLWTPDEPVRQYNRPLRAQSRPSFYSGFSQDSSDPRVKLHLGDNVGEIYRNLGERSFFTSALNQFLPVRMNQKLDEMFKPSTPSLLLSTDLRGSESSEPIVLASNSRSPLTWHSYPDRRFGEVSNSSRLMVSQRSQTNGKVLNFSNMKANKDPITEESRLNDKSMDLGLDRPEFIGRYKSGTRKLDKLIKDQDEISIDTKSELRNLDEPSIGY